jgi:hypothetical protein
MSSLILQPLLPSLEEWARYRASVHGKKTSNARGVQPTVSQWATLVNNSKIRCESYHNEFTLLKCSSFGIFFRFDNAGVPDFFKRLQFVDIFMT